MSRDNPLNAYFEAIILEVGDFDYAISGKAFLQAAAEAVELLDSEFCAICSVNTRDIHEYYMVNHDLWKRSGVADGMLCIGCLEDRLGRELTRADFTDAPINTDPEEGLWERSARLRDRLAD